MNRQFVVKMLQAKQLEYQALKEIIPEPVVNRIEKLELELVEIAKEYFCTVMNGTDTKEQETTSEKTKTRKVTIE